MLHADSNSLVSFYKDQRIVPTLGIVLMNSNCFAVFFLAAF